MEKKPHPHPNYSLTPIPSPNGEGREDCKLEERGLLREIEIVVFLNKRRAFGNNIPSIGGAWGGF